MAIIVDACPAEAGWRYRLRDTQTARYVTDGTGAVEITAEIKAMMEWGGVQESPDANAVLNRWLNLARTRGSSDLSKKAVEPADRK